MLRCLVYIILEGTGHGTQGKHFLVLFFIAQNEHAVFVVIPVPGDLVQVALCHQRRLCTDIAPFIVLQILDPSLKFFDHNDAFGHHQRQSLSDHVYGGKEFHLSSQFIMISLLCLF